MLKRVVVFVMLLSVCASQEEPQADTTLMVIVEDSQEKFDFRKFDYCSINANCRERGDKHSACDCKIRPPRTYVLDDIIQFRQDIIDKHNELRNMFASGNEPNEHLNGKTASNMMSSTTTQSSNTSPNATEGTLRKVMTRAGTRMIKHILDKTSQEQV
jgi:hypothetical protein